MEKANNKRRLLELIKILRKKTDADTRLKLDDIIYELNKKNIEVNNRKTLYDDFKVLNQYGINVEYDHGYYLLDAPFNLSEIKIIVDSINTLKNLDNNFIEDLNKKMYTYISCNDTKLLEYLKYTTNHSDSKLLQHMEDIIDSIKYNTSVFVTTKTNSEKTEIFPVFLHRANDYYYFYYHYPKSSKLYHYRFDNIKSISLSENKDEISISRKTIINKINESSKSYSKGESEIVTIELLNDDDRLVSRFLDDFPGAIHTNNGFSLKASINNVFFAKLVQYENDIKIKEKSVAKKYIKYLKSIINNY